MIGLVVSGLFLAVLVLGTFALYVMITRETSNPTVTDRRTAEAEAQTQGGFERGHPSTRDRHDDTATGSEEPKPDRERR